MADLITYRKVFADQSSRVCCEHVRANKVEEFIAYLTAATPENMRRSSTEQPYFICEIRGQQ